MKNNTLTRISAILLAVFVAFSMLCVFTGEADAASGPVKLDKKTYWVGEESWGSAPVLPTGNNWDAVDNAKLVSVKSSKSSVLKAVKDGNDLYGYYLMPKKAGKSKITVKYKLKGKTYTMSRTYSVKKYPNPIKALKLNGKTIKTSKNKFSLNTDGYKKTSAKIKITPNSGWKITLAYITLVKGDINKLKEIKPSVFKKGGSIKIPSGYNGYIFINLENSKGETFNYGVRFFREKI